jgi:alpha-beta hydrolase superfamily lysophospholipase
MPIEETSTAATAKATFRVGAETLHRRSVHPSTRAWAHLAVLHGYGEHGGRHLHVMRWFAERGVACHSFDFRGQGLSTGRRGFCGRWEEYLDDLDAFLALEDLQPEARQGRPLFILGHSHGALVLAAAGIRGLPGVAGCIFTAPYLRSNMAVPRYKIATAYLLQRAAPSLRVPNGLRDEWMSSDDAMVRDSGRDELIVRTATPRWYVSHLRAQQEVLARAGEFRLPLLALMGDADRVADPRAAAEFCRRAGSDDVTLRVYPDRLHELLREAGREQIFAHVLEWLRERAVAPG